MTFKRLKILVGKLHQLVTFNNKPERINNWIDEYQDGVRYGLEGKILVDENSGHQRITVIDSKRYGKGLLLDGCWMTTVKQERHYHECLVHTALCSAYKIEKVLIIGGGDGGTARECLRHKEIKHIDLVEIDSRVVELCKEYLPSIGGMAWRDSRLKLNIQDGIDWVKNSAKASYDVVIIDGSDPAGPAKGLFNKAFYEDCRRILRPGGIFATQSESPEAFLQVHLDTVRMIREVFEFADPIYGSVPIYPSGWWSWTFAANDYKRYLQPVPKRVEEISKDCEIWSLRWQKGAFEAMPAFIERALNK